MKTIMTLAPLAAGLLLALNAAAQDHSQYQMPMPAAQDHSQHQMPAMQDHTQHQVKPKAVPKVKPKPKAKPAATPKTKAAVPAAPMDHAAMGHAMPAQQPAAVDHSAMGHDAAQPVPMDHAAIGHAMPRPADQPITPIPVLTDEVRAAAIPPPNYHPVHDNDVQHYVLFNRLEGFDTDDGTGMAWEGQAWVGTDLNKL
ncbi:hypothetical protein [Thermomonas sp. S9]|nr:hypothetical protein [Thermomonas sp. S9]